MHTKRVQRGAWLTTYMTDNHLCCPKCTQEVIQNHIKAGAEGNSRKASGVPQLLKAVKEFFSMYMNAESLGWMKAMSLWHSFTKEEAGLELWALKERVQESIIQCTSHGGEKESSISARSPAGTACTSRSARLPRSY